MPNQLEQNIDGWAEKILQGDAQSISRAISAVENQDGRARELLKRLFPHTGRAAIIGITGATGSGKSTLVDGLTALLRKQGKTVGILAVDPTSPFSGGAILGDRIRMQTHWNDPSVYIRSMATRGSMGGLSVATLDAALILDAAGKDFVLVETVGVGQDEVEIAQLADVTLLLLVPGMGDDVQAFKAGIMEIADIFVINKADLPGADRVEQDVHALLSLAAPTSRSPQHVQMTRGGRRDLPQTPTEGMPRRAHQGGSGWLPPVIRTIATRQDGRSGGPSEGLDQLLEAIFKYLEFSQNEGGWERRRVDCWRERLVEILRDRLLEHVTQEFLTNDALNQYAASIAARAEDPYSVADQILEQAEWTRSSSPKQDDWKQGSQADQGAHESRQGSQSLTVLDHLGVAVKSLAEAVKLYRNILGLEVSGYETIPQEKTNVAMLRLGESRMELLEASERDSPIGRFLAKRGPGLHHLCLRVPDLAAAIARLQQSGIKLINPEPALGAGGHRYVFVHPASTGGVLLELVEDHPSRDREGAGEESVTRDQ